MGLPRAFGAGRTWLLLSILAPVSMLVVAGSMLSVVRPDAYDGKVGSTSRSLPQLIERDVARNIVFIDLTLQAVQDDKRAPGLAQLGPAVRLDRAATGRPLGGMFVHDELGEIIEDRGAFLPRKGHCTHCDHFRTHKANVRPHFRVERPITSSRGTIS